MKKKFLFIVGAMLFMLVGTVLTACSSDNDVDTPNSSATGHSTRQMPKQVNFIKTVTDISAISGVIRRTIRGISNPLIRDQK